MPIMQSYAAGDFCWVDYVAHDMATALSYYSALFDWDAHQMDAEGTPPYAQFALGEQLIAGCGQMNDEMKSQGIPPMWNSYVNVEDIEAITAAVESLGGQVPVPVIEAGDFGRLAFIQDPTGGMLGLWQAGSHIGATRIHEAGCFAWCELATRDADQASEFYGKLFGWTYEPNPHSPTKYLLIQNNGVRVGGVMQMTDDWGDEIPPHWAVYFGVSDMAAATERLQELGGSIGFGPFDSEAGPIAVTNDPQGAVVHLIQLKKPLVG